MLAVDVAAFALLIWTVWAALSDAFVDFDAEPGEGFVDIVFGSGHKSLRVCVFDAKNHFAVVAACEKIVVEGCSDASYM